LNENTNRCFEVGKVITSSGAVIVWLRNDCTFEGSAGSFGKIGVIVFDR